MEQTCCRWRKEYGGLQVDQAKRTPLRPEGRWASTWMSSAVNSGVLPGWAVCRGCGGYPAGFRRDDVVRGCRVGHFAREVFACMDDVARSILGGALG